MSVKANRCGWLMGQQVATRPVDRQTDKCKGEWGGKRWQPGGHGDDRDRDPQPPQCSGGAFSISEASSTETLLPGPRAHCVASSLGESGVWSGQGSPRKHGRGGMSEEELGVGEVLTTARPELPATRQGAPSGHCCCPSFPELVGSDLQIRLSPSRGKTVVPSLPKPSGLSGHEALCTGVCMCKREREIGHMCHAYLVSSARPIAQAASLGGSGTRRGPGRLSPCSHSTPPLCICSHSDRQLHPSTPCTFVPSCPVLVRAVRYGWAHGPGLHILHLLRPAAGTYDWPIDLSAWRSLSLGARK